MNKLQSFQQFLATQSVQVPVASFIINLFIAAFLSFILSRVYIRYGESLSNRRMFARNFMLITMTTMLVIAIVKSSLALSLGLVGALSIVRFRAAIKEPEELAYLFLSIGIGLGFGADQRLITVVAFFIIVGIICLKKFSHKYQDNQNLYLTISSQGAGKVDLDKAVEILKKHCVGLSLKRLDEAKDVMEAAFVVEFRDFNDLKTAKEELQKLKDSVKITFLDNKGIY
ncbi:MAG: DUF4956 domain-containing protein [Candidatus Omnitrophota bacterium]